VGIHLGKRYYVKMHFEMKLNEIEIKMPKFRNISISQIPIKLDEFDLLRKLVS
jgi:hypothetical protein